MNRKLIFLDIDGTLTEAGKNTPPASALDAVQRAQQVGHKVVLCSGRNYGMLRPLLEYPFDGIIGSSGNYAVVANCAAFGNVYAASPISTNFGGMAGGLVGMMAGKQYTSYAAGDITIANGGLAKDHHWVGALDGQVTTSGTTGGTAYPAEGAVRSANYYA